MWNSPPHHEQPGQNLLQLKLFNRNHFSKRLFVIWDSVLHEAVKADIADDVAQTGLTHEEERCVGAGQKELEEVLIV